MKNSVNKKLTALASVLRDKGLHKQASLIQSMADNGGITNADDALSFLKTCESNGLTKTALAPVAIWALTAVFGGGVVMGSVAMSDDAQDIMRDLGVKDFEREDAEDLFERYYNELARTDLIDGCDTFPDDHHNGPRWMRNFIKKWWVNDWPMDADDFQDSIEDDEDHYGENTNGICQFGLDNEDGWVEVYNLIRGLRTAQRLVKEKEKKDAEAAKAKAKAKPSAKKGKGPGYKEDDFWGDWPEVGEEEKKELKRKEVPVVKPSEPTPAQPASSTGETAEEKAHKELLEQVERAKEMRRKSRRRKSGKRAPIGGVVEED